MDIQDAQREIIWLVRTAGHLGLSKSVYPGRHHRGILHLPANSKRCCVCRAAPRP